MGGAKARSEYPSGSRERHGGSDMKAGEEHG